MFDVVWLHSRGGRVAARNLRLVAGLVASELANADLQHLLEGWGAVASDGCCVVDSDTKQIEDLASAALPGPRARRNRAGEQARVNVELVRFLVEHEARRS